MKDNKSMGFDEQIARSGDYILGRNARGKYRMYGYCWYGDQDASKEFAHHESYGRGTTAEKAIENWAKMAEKIGRVREGDCLGLTADEVAAVKSKLLAAVEDLEADEDRRDPVPIYLVTRKTVGNWPKTLYCGTDRLAARVIYHGSATEDGQMAETLCKVISDAKTDDFVDDTRETIEAHLPG